MGKLKQYNVTYRCEVKKTATVEAKSEKEAREKFDRFEYHDGDVIVVYNIDDVCIEEDE